MQSVVIVDAGIVVVAVRRTAAAVSVVMVCVAGERVVLAGVVVTRSVVCYSAVRGHVLLGVARAEAVLLSVVL